MKQMTLFGFGKSGEDKSSPTKSSPTKSSSDVLTKDQKSLIAKDTLNSTTWDKLLKEVDDGHVKNKRDLLSAVDDKFQCTICMDRIKEPVSLPCSHNFCLSCIKLGMEKAGKMSISNRI